MIQLSGKLARVYVGHRLIMTMLDWSLTRKAEALGSTESSGIARLHSVDPIWGRDRPTHISCRLGDHWWTWHGSPSVRVNPDNTVAFSVYGNPTISQTGRPYASR